MAIIVLLSVTLLAFNIVVSVHSIGTNRTYLIKKDFLSGLKGGEFTIYDSTGKQQQYRMESKFGITHDVRLFAGKSKKEVLARLKAKVTAVMYKATITILDANSNQWKNGTITQNFKIVGNKFMIEYGGRQISMEGKAFSLDTAFRDQSGGNILAQFRKRISSLFWRNKYDLQVISDRLPDAIYFLGVAARDHSNAKIHRG
ncbi:unnamed protein product [Didymodactylos carnosus]|uniref:Uncharacterized protein n=1 Tax=Didymodactylos carnosus TaxID=1234261 RepID=A0A815SMA5_9BILA|nr:unnamed protein product [Didymodactylos carnosus]CAF1494550.1 unnamed protein product [Didymodactylos carnosus]CAF3706482.1 unnamed protein product [Didymodactylos carnosus]CAF4357147.1 unnamed protein product [Didymodactylos carnosus]